VHQLVKAIQEAAWNST